MCVPMCFEFDPARTKRVIVHTNSSLYLLSDTPCRRSGLGDRVGVRLKLGVLSQELDSIAVARKSSRSRASVFFVKLCAYRGRVSQRLLKGIPSLGVVKSRKKKLTHHSHFFKA